MPCNIKLSIFATVLSMLSVKLTLPLQSKVKNRFETKLDFDIKGGVIMSIITMATNCLAGNGVCGECAEQWSKEFL
jgi:hypothetical protein